MALPPAYTKRFYANSNMPVGTTGLGGPPTGFRWVVRSIQFFQTADGADIHLGGGGVFDDSNVVCFWTPGGRTTGGVMYSFDGHFVLDHPNQLDAYVNEANWSLAIHGFELAVV